jgi:protein MpaA
MSAVKAAPFSIPPPWPPGLSGRRCGRASGVEVFGEAGGCPLFALTKRTAGPGPASTFRPASTGTSPPLPWRSSPSWSPGTSTAGHVVPLPAPEPGWPSPGHRENAAGIDLNRDYRVPVAGEVKAHIGWLQRQPNSTWPICVHEDWESPGLLPLRAQPDKRPSLAEPMIKAASRVCPIDMSP